MLSNQWLEEFLSSQEGVHYAKVAGDGYHYTITVVSDAFAGKSRVARQQWVYALLSTWIEDGSLHAVSLNTSTTSEWESQHG